MNPLYLHEDAELQRPRLSAVCRSLHRRGWMPGTSGSVSIRAGEAIMITTRDQSKRTISRQDTVLVDPFQGLPLLGETEWPAAETSMHLAIYQQVPGCGAIVHAHAPYATVLATVTGTTGFLGQAVFEGMELAKGLGVTDPHLVVVPIFTNWPDGSRIANDVSAYLDASAAGAPPALLIDRHGVTTWGPDLDEARNRLESIEELCRLTLLTSAFGAGVAKEHLR
ncbi:methylthioribulose 1-phosphate dehydratase [Streptomyces sp. NPDC053542]|uniref:methylthioribulose 1-phosphate dehydratase n=1 Tax=Streptomyces sp. NPDC053542 TaxID=3365710 RepID=UPI0037D78650